MCREHTLNTVSGVKFMNAFAYDRLIRILSAAKNLGNPSHVLLKRMFAKNSDIMTVVDRKTGVRCRCTLGSHHAFATTWYSRDYDVPGVPIRPGDVVIDIGANQGFFTCYAASKGANVYAFEPCPTNYERLLQNVKQNGFDDRVVARPWAITDHAGSINVMVSQEMGGAMTTTIPNFAENARITVIETVTAPCYTFPQVLEQFSLGQVRVCKIDAEGAELQILSQLDPNRFPSIDSFVMEYHVEAYTLAELISLLLGWGTYQVSFMEEKPFTGNVLRAVANRVLLGETSRPDEHNLQESTSVK